VYCFFLKLITPYTILSVDIIFDTLIYSPIQFVTHVNLIGIKIVVTQLKLTSITSISHFSMVNLLQNVCTAGKKSTKLYYVRYFKNI